ncbi:MAG: DDE-type integrase/transposase/recombinase [Pseudonocardiales bacterium]|nr:DDE-type integrase/transposase/recombinase [Pseudonocardiales bacterium]
MAQHQELDIFRRRRATEQQPQVQQPEEDQVEQTQRHGTRSCLPVERTAHPGQRHRPTSGTPQVTPRQNTKAATRFFRKLLKGLKYVPRVLVTDTLASYGVAHRRLIPGVEHHRSKYRNNRAENSHQPTRARERAMRKFTSPGSCKKLRCCFRVWRSLIWYGGFERGP